MVQIIDDSMNRSVDNNKIVSVNEAEQKIALYCENLNASSDGQFRYEYEAHDNGVIEVKRWDTNAKIDEKNDIPQYGYDSVYIPTNSNTSNLMSYVPGNEGRAADDNVLVDQIIEGNGNFNYIVSISNSAKDENKSMFLATDIAKVIGTEIDNVAVNAFSAGGAYGFNSLEEYLEANPDVKASLVVSDGIQHFHEHFHDTNALIQNCDSLVENDVPIIFVTLEDGKKYNDLEKWLYSKGMTNIYTLMQANQFDHAWNDSDHVGLNRNILNNQITQYFLNVNDSFVDYNLDECDYRFYHFDPNDENANAYGWVETSIYDVKLLEKIVEDRLSKLDANSLTEGTLTSDIFKVYEAMQSLNEACNYNALLESDFLTLNGGSTTSIPAGLMGALGDVLGINRNLAGELSNESKVIMSIANVIYQMDCNLAKSGEGLSVDSDVLYNSGKVLLDSLNSIKFDYFDVPKKMCEYVSLQEGKAGKLSLSDLTSLCSNGKLCGKLKDSIDSDMMNADEIIRLLDSVALNDSNYFQGDIWDSVRLQLDEYSQLMEYRKKSMVTLENAYERAIAFLVAYMGDYTCLDDSRLDYLKSEIERLEALIASWNEKIYSKRTVRVKDVNEKGEVFFWEYEEYVYSEHERNMGRLIIEDSEKEIADIKKEIAKLEGLSDAVTFAETIVNDALNEIYAGYGESVQSIKSHSEIVYEL